MVNTSQQPKLFPVYGSLLGTLA